jgi:hypothetical protein
MTAFPFMNIYDNLVARELHPRQYKIKSVWGCFIVVSV